MKYFIFCLIFFCAVVVAQEVPVIPEDPTFQQLWDMAINLIGNWKAMGTPVKIGMAIFLIISLTKNSILRQYTWDKIKYVWIKNFVGPVASLIIFALFVSPFTLKTVAIALITGAGTGYLADILKAIRTIPGLGEVWIKIIDFVGKLLQKKDEDLLENR